MRFNQAIILLLLLWICSCKSGSRLKDANQKKIIDFPYELEASKIFKLPSELQEISGLSLSEDQKYLLAVQDENGIIYYLDKNTGELIKKLDFKIDGDYEGVCYNDGLCYVLKSSGTIYEIDLADKELAVKKHKGLLEKTTDHEGITFDKMKNKFVVCCKDSEGLGEQYKNTRFIYSLDLQKRTKEVFFTLSRREVIEYLRSSCSSEEIEEDHDKIFDMKRDYLHAGPSGICIHPINGLVYTICSKGKYMFICTRKGEIKKVIKFDKSILPQPEGIVIDVDGTMYISSENEKGGEGILSVYPMKQ